MNVSDVQARVDAIRWYHVIDLGNGIRTPGQYDPAPRIDRYNLPDLHGKHVLDIGAWDGWFSFEAERRGASRVLATDSFSWGLEPSHWGTKAGFQLAREALGSKVEDETIDVLDLSPERVGTFDVVFFLGVLYHMRHPQLAIDKVASVCRGTVIVETHVDLLLNRRPAMALYAPNELRDDPTNWSGPNPQAIELMFKRAGFRRLETQPPTGAVQDVARWAISRARRRGRHMVFHAHRQ